LPAGYVKKPNSMLPLIKIIYRKYPKFIEAVRTRHIRYNQCLKTLDEWCNRGMAFRIRPSESFDIDRLEKDMYRHYKKATMVYTVIESNALGALPQGFRRPRHAP
jgi:predicted patatin/cPLA2 family phospholipase